jgi:hypothetical protein
MDFVVFSDDWGVHPSSCQHIFRHIAREHRTLWVNTVGMRAPKLSVGDLSKAVEKLAGMLGARQTARAEWTERPPLLHVIRPPMLPLPGSRIANRFNTRSTQRAVESALDRLSMKDPIVVATVPNVCDTVSRLAAGQRIYYCVDDFSQWPGLAHDMVRSMEDRLVASADVILAASPNLQRRFAHFSGTVVSFPHGVDLNLFRGPLPVPPAWLSGLTMPRVGFYGLLDERLDQELIREVALSNPEWSFVLAGPRGAPMDILEDVPGIHFPGNVSYRDLPAFVGGLDALILPYRVDRFTHTLAPLKLNEYLLSGLPVITSDIAGVQAHGSLVRIARSAADWTASLRESIPAGRAARQALAEEQLAYHDWARRADTLLDLCTSLTR